MVYIITKNDGPRKEDVAARKLIENNRSTIERLANHLSRRPVAGDQAGALGAASSWTEPERDTVAGYQPTGRSTSTRPYVRISPNNRVVVVDEETSRQVLFLGELRRGPEGERFRLATRENGFFDPLRGRRARLPHRSRRAADARRGGARGVQAGTGDAPRHCRHDERRRLIRAQAPLHRLQPQDTTAFMDARMPTEAPMVKPQRPFMPSLPPGGTEPGRQGPQDRSGRRRLLRRDGDDGGVGAAIGRRPQAGGGARPRRDRAFLAAQRALRRRCARARQRAHRLDRRGRPAANGRTPISSTLPARPSDGSPKCWAIPRPWW